LERAKCQLSELFDNVKIDESHGIHHAE